jgi:SHS2 domain-containing protein
MEKAYEILPHTADLKIRAYGASLPQLFSNALRGMFAALLPQKTVPVNLVEHTVTIHATKIEYLLVEFLSECLYLSDTHHEAYDQACITTLTPTTITATIKGYTISGLQESEIKAVTYHELAIEQKNGLWQATIVFDI